MFKPNQNNKKGFTIIEVVLVLAIAGLIFLMVFIALPALQRSQRDAQRKEDIGKVLSQLQQYQSNNRGRIPGEVTKSTSATEENKADFEGWTSAENESKVGKDPKKWEYFYGKYLISENGDDFQDPSGKPYGLKVLSADKDDGGSEATTAGLSKTFKEQFDNGAKMLIVTNSRCDGESTTYVSQRRNVSVLYRGESGNVMCQNN